MDGKANIDGFSTEQVARLARVTLRQLQWWDETRLIRPAGRRYARNRQYTYDDLFRALLVSELRRRKLPLQRVRNFLKAFTRADRREVERAPALVIDSPGCKYALVNDLNDVLALCERWRGPVLVIDLKKLREKQL